MYVDVCDVFMCYLVDLFLISESMLQVFELILNSRALKDNDGANITSLQQSLKTLCERQVVFKSVVYLLAVAI